ncbi:cytochrome P450 [Cryptosporangium sp. NPDC048952]|uniref:cytochrome P450 n=1 Tax=Cryptosporangium sp. NPDC048952 TaxID=3363961 RepID=UPI00371AE15E
MDFPMQRDATCPFDPAPEVIALAATEPVTRVRIWDGSTPWLITGNDELHALAADPRVSVDHHLPGFPHWNEGMAVMAPHRPKSITTVDGAEHTRLRRMATRSFSFKRVNALRPVIQRITDEHIDAMLAGPKPADLVPALALPVPSLMICDLLGVPAEDREFFETAAASALDRYATAGSQRENYAALGKYVDRLVESKYDTSDDEDGSVVADYARLVREGTLTLAEARQMCTTLLFAGHETSANMIGLGALAVLRNPDQLAVLRDSDDEKEIANAVEELLRYLSIIHNGQRRIAVDDIDIGGQVIRAGDGIVLDFSAGNWDTRVFDDPARLDLHRDAGRHVAFGFGPHVCVGQQLARAELQIVFSTLFRRVPTLEAAIPLEQVAFKHDRLAYGVYSLPVTWS